MNRRGTILIIVASICALLASLTLAFIARTRTSVEETNSFVADVQARIMLIAACSYICEASRIGYEPRKDSDIIAKFGNIDRGHIEAFGWIDVRVDPVLAANDPNSYPKPAGWTKSWWTPTIGPNTRDYDTSNKFGSRIIVPLYDSSDLSVDTGLPSPNDKRPAWPAIKGVARCPMYNMVRPPFAVELTTVYNPVSEMKGNPKNPKTIGTPLLEKPDPRPVSFDGYADDVQNISNMRGEDLTPIIESAGRSWFRICRDGPTTFIITVGAGATAGWRDYKEVQAAGRTAEFNNDPAYFEVLLAQEPRFWYRVQWSPAVLSGAQHSVLGVGYDGNLDNTVVLYPMNNSMAMEHLTWSNGEETLGIKANLESKMGSRSNGVNQAGTISWVQRLRSPPNLW
jgi:hypothetical protein